MNIPIPSMRGSSTSKRGTGRPGILLVNTVDGVRHFRVGKGEAIITSTDGSGDVTSAYCIPR